MEFAWDGLAGRRVCDLVLVCELGGWGRNCGFWFLAGWWVILD